MVLGRAEPAHHADFTAFVAAAGMSLHRSAWLLTGDRDLAQDLVQATWLKLYLNWRRHDQWASPHAYAQRVLYTTFCSWRGRRWHGEVPTADLPDVVLDPGGAAADVDLVRALGRLTRRQRAVIVARFYDDLSVEEAAQQLGCSIGTVKSQTFKALGRLRAVLEEAAFSMGETR